MSENKLQNLLNKEEFAWIQTTLLPLFSLLDIKEKGEYVSGEYDGLIGFEFTLPLSKENVIRNLCRISNKSENLIIDELNAFENEFKDHIKSSNITELNYLYRPTDRDYKHKSYTCTGENSEKYYILKPELRKKSNDIDISIENNVKDIFIETLKKSLSQKGTIKVKELIYLAILKTIVKKCQFVRYYEFFKEGKVDLKIFLREIEIDDKIINFAVDNSDSPFNEFFVGTNINFADFENFNEKIFLLRDQKWYALFYSHCFNSTGCYLKNNIIIRKGEAKILYEILKEFPLEEKLKECYTQIKTEYKDVNQDQLPLFEFKDKVLRFLEKYKDKINKSDFELFFVSKVDPDENEILNFLKSEKLLIVKEGRILSKDINLLNNKRLDLEQKENLRIGRNISDIFFAWIRTDIAFEVNITSKDSTIGKPPIKIIPPPVPQPILQPEFHQDKIIIGSNSSHGQEGIIGKIDNKEIFLDFYEPHAITILGVQGSGKSYAAGTIIEMAVREITKISNIKRPLSCLIFHFSREEKRRPEWIGLTNSNDDDRQIQLLKTQYGVEPSSISINNLNIFVPPSIFEKREKEYKNLNVKKLFLSPSELKAEDWIRLLTYGKGNESIYIQRIKKIISDLRHQSFDLQDIKNEINQTNQLDSKQKRLAINRLENIEVWLSQNAPSLYNFLKPGIINIVDFRDPGFIDEETASILLQTIFSLVKDRPSEDICLICIDEAHLFLQNTALSNEIVAFVKMLRKDYKVYIILISQHPKDFHKDIIGLSDVIICHRLESHEELKFLSTHKPEFASVIDKIPHLKTKEGEAYVLARVSTNSELDQPKLIKIRPKLSSDLGKTFTAF